MLKGQRKGKKGEKEACEWLEFHLFNNQITLRRNPDQVKYGYDIFGHPFIFEVKRREKLNLNKWWMQIITVRDKMAVDGKETIPIVMFRQNNAFWEFLIAAEAIGITGGWVHINSVQFKKWAKQYVTIG